MTVDAAAIGRRATLALLTAASAMLGIDAVAQTPTSAEPMHTIRTEAGDTLIGLGRRLLRDPSRWPELARVNRIRDPDRIPTGVELAIPLRLMHTDPVDATVIDVVGEARHAGTVLVPGGAPLPEGAEISTGADGHVTLRLVDGTLLRLRPGSRLRLNESRRVRDTTSVRSGVQLEQGRVEVDAAPAPRGLPGFRIGTPQGVLGVRGTEFRVAALDDGTRGEVLGGVVAVDGAAGSPGQRVEAGFGTVVDRSGAVAAPVRLLAPPDTSGLPMLQERILVRFELPAQSQAGAWRAQVARDAGFEKVLAELTSSTPELRIADLPDGDYVLRVRAIDARGLEGRNADHRFRLKARPEAPLPAAPAPRAVLFGDRVEFGWAANDDAARYRLQLATDPSFATPLRDLPDLRGLSTVIDGLPPGSYHWRLRSLRADGDAGPWGAVRSFDLRPNPPAAKPPAVGDRVVSFSWEGRPGQTFDFEVARDEAFADKLIERRLEQAAIELPRPGPGRYFVRLRAREADGFIGPWATTQRFEVQNCLRDADGACVRGAGGESLILGR